VSGDDVWQQRDDVSVVEASVVAVIMRKPAETVLSQKMFFLDYFAGMINLPVLFLPRHARTLHAVGRSVPMHDAAALAHSQNHT
jgi:hypothetical protein